MASSGCVCYILLPNKLLRVACAQPTAFSTGEDGQDTPVNTPPQCVSLQVAEQLRHHLRRGRQLEPCFQTLLLSTPHLHNHGSWTSHHHPAQQGCGWHTVNIFGLKILCKSGSSKPLSTCICCFSFPFKMFTSMRPGGTLMGKSSH